MTQVFISHSHQDQELVDAFVDLLNAGLNIQRNNIFCSSQADMGTPIGERTAEYIKSKLQESLVVLLLVSRAYLDSQYSLQEAGAAYGLSRPVIPILVPPVRRDDLKGFPEGTKTGIIDERDTLNELKDRLPEQLELMPLRTAQWEAQRGKFLKRISSTLQGQQSPSDAGRNHETLQVSGRTPAPVALTSQPVIETLEQRLQQMTQERLRLLLLGRTGVGKSSTVNSLFNEDIAPVGHEKPTTLKVRSYKSKAQRNVEVVDTPGLCDDLEIAGNDKVYLSEIRKRVPEVHCCCFLTPLYETRMRPDERRAIRLITQAFGKQMWARSVIIFTFADYIPTTQYADKLRSRTRMVRSVISEYTSGPVSNKIPAVAVSNVSASTPDGPWHDELFTMMCDRIAAKQALPFALAVIKGGKRPKLNDRQRETVKAAIRRSRTGIGKGNNKEDSGDWLTPLIAGSAMGAKVGGAPGALIGGLLGGLVGLFRS